MSRRHTVAAIAFCASFVACATLLERYDAAKTAEEAMAVLADEPTLDFTFDGWHHSPLSVAAMRNDVVLVERLLKAGASVDFVLKRGQTALTAACDRLAYDAVRVLVAAGARSVGCVEHAVDARLDRPEVIERLVAAGLDVKAPQERAGHAPLLHALAVNDQHKTLDALVRHGLPLDVRDERGDTALIAAVAHGNLHAVRGLLERGLDPRTATEGDLWHRVETYKLEPLPRSPASRDEVLLAAFAEETPAARVAAFDRVTAEVAARLAADVAARKKAQAEAEQREKEKLAAQQKAQREEEAKDRAFRAMIAGVNAARAAKEPVVERRLPEICYRPDIAACREKGKTCSDCFYESLPAGTKTSATCPHNTDPCGEQCCGDGYVCCVFGDNAGFACQDSASSCRGWGWMKKTDWDRGMR